MNSFFVRLMIYIEKKYLSNEDIELLKNKNIGGVILFSRNYESRAQIKDLVSSIKKIKNNLLVAVDQEGGRVQRFSHDFTKIPSMQMISEYVSAHNDVSLFKDTGTSVFTCTYKSVFNSVLPPPDLSRLKIA